MKLTREQDIAEHRKMWYWIAEETIKRQERRIKYGEDISFRINETHR